jgi:hypothetical protein
MIAVRSEVTIYEIKCEKVSDTPPLVVESHWNDDAMVVISMPGVVPLTVSGFHLKRAIDNAMNTGRF